MRESPVTDRIRVLHERATRHQAELDKDSAFYSVADLAARWSCAENTVRAIPITSLPFLNLSHGARNTLRRYRPADVDAYETARLERAG